MPLKTCFQIFLNAQLSIPIVCITFAFLLGSIVYKFVFPVVKHYRKCVDLTARGCSLPRHWLYGHAKLFSTGHESLKRRASEFARLKGIFITWVGPLYAFVMPHRPETVGKVLYSNHPKDEVTYRMLRPWLGDGLLTASGRKWHRNRKLLNLAFHSNILKSYLTINNQCAKIFVSKWLQRNGNYRDVTSDVSNLTMDVMLQCAMSTTTNCQMDSSSEYINAIKELSRITLHRCFSPLLLVDWIFWLSPSGRKFRKAANYVHTEGERLIKERRATLKRKSINEKIKSPDCDHQSNLSTSMKREHFDFIDILLKSKDENERGLSIKEIRDEVDTFLFEGHDTTASGISWLLYNLARHPDYQQRCREEVMKIMGRREEVEWDDLQQLTYLGMCIKESLRLHPPVPSIARKLSKKTTFVDKYTPGGKLEVEAGMSVLVHVWVVHRSELNWKNPLQYDPEHFSHENTAKQEPLSYMAFSAGPRSCIGKTFAMNGIKVTMCHVLRNFKLSVDAQCPETRLELGLVLKSESGIHVKIENL